MDISDLLQPGRKPVCRFQSGQDQQIVYFSGLIVLLVDRADLSRYHKPGFYGIRRHGIPDPIFFLQSVQTVSLRFQFFLKFFPPLRMGKISGPHQVNAFFPGPQLQMLRISFFAGGSGKTGMDM